MSDALSPARKAFLWGPLAIVDRYGPTLGPYGLAVYAAVARGVRDNDAQVSEVSRRDVARLTGVGPTKVKETLRLLQRLGLVAIQAVTDEQGKQLENRYTLLDPPEEVRPNYAGHPVRGDVVRDMHGRFWAIRHWVLDEYGARMGPFGIACYVVLARYVDYDDKQTVRFVAKRRIRAQTGMALSTITTALHELAALGVLAIEEQQTEDGQLANIYTLLQQPSSGGRQADGGGRETIGRGRSADGGGREVHGEGRAGDGGPAAGRRGLVAGRSVKDNNSVPTRINDNDAIATERRALTETAGPLFDVPATMDERFAAALADLREQILPANYQRWLSRLRFLGFEDRTVRLACPNEMTRDQLRRRFDPLVRRALCDAFGVPDCRVSYDVAEEA